MAYNQGKTAKRKMWKMRELFLIFLLFICFSIINGQDTTYYLASASGLNDGSDWTNAFTTLDSLIHARRGRGDVAFIGAGNYYDHYIYFYTGRVGTERFKILHATTTNHGTETGWDDSYADPSHFYLGTYQEDGSNSNKWMYGIQGFLTIDGGYRPTDWSDSLNYGFVIHGFANPDSTGRITIDFDLGNENGDNEIVIRNTAMILHGYQGETTTGQLGIRLIARNGYETRNDTVEYCFISGGSTNFSIRETREIVIRYNYFSNNYHTPIAHGQQISGGGDDTCLIHTNIFKNSGTFVLGFHASLNTSNKYINFFNNIIDSCEESNMTAVCGLADSNIPDSIINWRVNNNTLIDLDAGGKGLLFVGVMHDTANNKCYSYNNLAFNCQNIHFQNGEQEDSLHLIVHDYNAWYTCAVGSNQTQSQDAEDNAIVELSSNPFSSGYEPAFSIPGTTLTDFTIDFDGDTRVEYTRGALEYFNGYLKEILIRFTGGHR